MEPQAPEAPQTVPLQPEQDDRSLSPYSPPTPNSTSPRTPAGDATTPYGGYDGPTSSGPYGGPAGPYGPYGGYGLSPMEPSRPRSYRPWYIAAAALAVIAALVTMFAIGRASSPSTTANGPSSVSPGATVAVPPAAQDLQQTVVNVVRTVQPSVVEVTSIGGQGEAIGSGVVYSSDGYIVTNDHVVTGFSRYSVTLSNGNNVSATLVGEDPQDDLAVLKVNASLTPMNIANSSDVQVGQFSIAVGNPLGLQQSATFGIVSALNRTASEGSSGPASTLTGLIQTSAPINHGNSGGALVNLQGQLIGIPTLGAADPQSGGAANGIGFAIASNRVKFVADQLIKSGHLTTSGQGFLGISGQNVTAADGLSANHGVLVAGFGNDASGKSPAQQAGIQNGDIILAINGQSIPDQDTLASVLQGTPPGTKITVTVQRGSGQQTVNVTLGERPAKAQG